MRGQAGPSPIMRCPVLCAKGPDGSLDRCGTGTCRLARACAACPSPPFPRLSEDRGVGRNSAGHSSDGSPSTSPVQPGFQAKGHDAPLLRPPSETSQVARTCPLCQAGCHIPQCVVLPWVVSGWGMGHFSVSRAGWPRPGPALCGCSCQGQHLNSFHRGKSARQVANPTHALTGDAGKQAPRKPFQIPGAHIQALDLASPGNRTTRGANTGKTKP
jgi:hypothetical protein